MLRSLERGMLVLWDRGFHDFDMIVGARRRGAHVLSRLPSHVKPQRIRTLCAVAEFQMVAVEQLPALYRRLLEDIGAQRLPERRPRTNPRVVKQKMSKFKLKRAEHYRPPKPSGSFRDAVVIQPAPADEPIALLELPAYPLWSEAALLDLRPPERCLI